MVKQKLSKKQKDNITMATREIINSARDFKSGYTKSPCMGCPVAGMR